MAPVLDCHITPGVLAVIVVVVVASVVLAYIIGAACVKAWSNKSPTYVYCARCNQFIGSLNVGRPPHLVPGFHVPSYNNFYDVPNMRVNASKHDDRPPTGTFQRLGMRTSKSNRSSTFPIILSPIQASPPDKITTTSEMERLTPVAEAPVSKYLNQPGAVLSKPSTPNDPSSDTKVGSLSKKTQQSSGNVNTGMLETGFMSGDDSVFYQEKEGGDCRRSRDVSKMSQVRILASPPPIEASKLQGALIAKTPANANKSNRNVESSSCQPVTSGPSKVKSSIRSSLRDKGQARRSVQSEGSGKSRRSLMSRKLRLFSDDRKPKNSRDTQYSPLVNQNPTTTEDSCGIGSDNVGENQTYPNCDSINNSDARKNVMAQEKSSNRLEIDAQEVQGNNHGFIQEGAVLNTDSLGYPNEVTSNNEMTMGGNKIMDSEAKKAVKRGSPGNTGNVSIPHLLVDIDVDSSLPPISSEIAGDHCEAGANNSYEANDSGRLVKNEMLKNMTKQKIRSSSSSRKEKAQYLGKRPGFTESDMTSQSEDERPRTRIASLGRSHLAGMSQSEEVENTYRKERDNGVPSSETPSHTPQYPVQNSKHVTTKRGTPIPSSLPICTPKFVTVRERNNAVDTSNYPPNSWDSKNNSNFPPNSWDPASQDFVKSKPFDLSAHSGQVNLSMSSCVNNLSATAMDNSTPAEGNHTSSPHSSANLAMFKPQDLSIPGLDTSLAESSPPLVQDGRYSKPLNNQMVQQLTLPNATQNQSSEVLTPHIYNRNSQGFLEKDAEKLGSINSPSNMSWKNDARYPTEMLSNLNNSTGSVASQNQLLKLNHDSSKESQDTIRGVSLDSTSTLVPSPVNTNNRSQLEAFATRTPLVSKSSPSPQHSLIPRPIKLNHQTRSMPPTSQWSRVQEHALPPSLPPLAPKPRINVQLPANTPDQSLVPKTRINAAVPDNTPGQSLQSPKTSINVAVLANTAGQSLAPKTRINVQVSANTPGQSLQSPKTRINAAVPANTPGQSLQSPANTSGQSFQSPAHSIQESGTHVPNIRTQNVRSMPPASQWSRVKEHALPPSLPPLASKSRILSSEVPNNSHGNIKPTPTNTGSNNLTDLPGLLPPWILQSLHSADHLPRVKEYTLPPSLPLSHDALLQQMQSLPLAPEWSWVNEHIPSPFLPPSHAALPQQMGSMPPAPQWLKVHAPPPLLPSHNPLMQQLRSLPPAPRWPRVPPPAAKTRIPCFGIQRNFDTGARGRRMRVMSEERNVSASHIGSGKSRSSSASGVSMSGGDSGPADSGDRQSQVERVPRSPVVGVAGGTQSQVTCGPVRSMIQEPSRSQLVAGQANSQIDSRSRSTTESSHPASLMWDSYGSDPSFVPRRPEDLEYFTLSSESESNKMMSKGEQMFYRSDGAIVQNRDIREAGIVWESGPFGSSYFQTGVRTRSQSR